jgi:hypothetical protein
VADAVAPTTAALREAAGEGELTKFFDVNLTQLLTDTPLRDTLEVRILPGSIDPDAIVSQAALLELLLDRCEAPDPFPAALPGTDPVAALLETAAEALAARG